MIWPFKKKIKAILPIVSAVETRLCIPGSWRSQEDIYQKVLSAGGGEYMAAGGYIINVPAKRHYKLELFERDDKLAGIFQVAGKPAGIGPDSLHSIENHKTVAYLTGATGDLDGAYLMACAASVMLKAGGLGVKVETAGKAFDSKQWQRSTKTYDEASLFELFVLNSVTMADGAVFSCGMHNLGLKDTIVSDEDFQTAYELISIFGFYQIFDKPVILPGQTFQRDAHSPVYRIGEELTQPYRGDPLSENNVVMWRLTRIQG